MSDPTILGSSGKPLPPVPTSCPSCGADKSKRVKSAGFGEPHDVCGKCGHEWSREESL